MNSRDHRFNHNLTLFKHVTDFLGDMPDDAGVSHEKIPFLSAHRQHRHQATNAVQVFDLAELAESAKARQESEHDRLKSHLTDLEAARRGGGLRHLLTHSRQQIVADLEALRCEMPNFSEVIDILSAELALSLAGKPEDFHVSSVCMNGTPGIGKTRFGRELARLLDVACDVISLGAAYGGFELAGVSPGWGSTRSGRLFRLLAYGKSACHVVLLDEVDKMPNHSNYPALPVILDLLEVDSSRKFRDEGLEIRFDASKLIFIATSNEYDNIPAPLQSRTRMVEILPPTAEQRLGIAERIANTYARKVEVNFQPAVLEAIAAPDIDLRELHRSLREMAGLALAKEKKEVTLQELKPRKPTAKRAIGFLSESRKLP